MKCLTIKTGDNTTTEIHLLHPGEIFPEFGGSSRGLAVKKTASLITRADTGAGGREDVERAITDKNVWEFISRCINGDIKATASIT